MVDSGYVDAAGVRTYYEVEGAGDPLLLLHGGLTTIETWAAQRAALVAAGYRVFLPERRGHGRTPDVPGPLGYELMAADTIAFMDAVGVESAHLVGWSDGGAVALQISLSRPELVRKMVLIGTGAHIDGYTDETKEWNVSGTAESMPPFLREPYDRLSPDGPEHFPVVYRKHAAMWQTEPRHGAAELARVQAPTLVMLGDHDVLTVEHAAEMARSIPKAQLAVVPGTGHGVMFDKPELVNLLILDFLAE